MFKRIDEYPEATGLDATDYLIVSHDIGGGTRKYRKVAKSNAIPEIPGIPKTGNLAWVDQVNGNDGTANVGRIDKPYKTLLGARGGAIANGGATIIVLPGTYDERDLLADGVNWYFTPGARIQYTTGGLYVFDDHGTTMTSFISGGRLTTGAIGLMFQLTGANTNVVCHCQEINTNGGTAVNMTDGVLTLIVDAGFAGSVTNNGGQLNLYTNEAIGALTISSLAVPGNQIRCGGAGNVSLNANTNFVSLSDIGSLTMGNGTHNVVVHGALSSITLTEGVATVRCHAISGFVAASSTTSSFLTLHFETITGTLTLDASVGFTNAKIFGDFIERIVLIDAGLFVLNITQANSVYANCPGGYAIVNGARISNSSQVSGSLAPVEVDNGATVRLQNCVLISNGTPTSTVHGIVGTEVVKFYGGTVGNFTTDNITVAVGTLVVDTDVD